MSKKNKTEKLFFSKTLDFLDHYLPEQAKKSVNTVETYRDAVADFSACPIVAPLVCHGVALYTVF